MSQVRMAAVVPVYNRAALVREALDSIARQSRTPDHLIIIDDGSTDGTAGVIERWTSEQSRLRVSVIHQANQGASIARNAGVATAGDCDLLAFLDSDDLWPRDFLARAVARMEAAPALVAASIDQLHIDTSTGEATFVDQSMYQGAITPLLLEPSMPPVPSATVVRGEHFRALGGFDANYAISQDRHFFMRLSLRGPWAYLPGRPLTYRRNLGAQGDSAPQLTERFWNCGERELWWTMAERFVLEQGGSGAVPLEAWKKRAAKEWIEMGRRRARRMQFAEATRCFEHALTLDQGRREAKRLLRQTRWRQRWQDWTSPRPRAITAPPLAANPRVAVIVPAYCRAAVIEEALDSIAVQSRKPDRLVVVDDGSSDGTADRVQQWIDRHRGQLAAEFITQPNAGASAARNRGVKAAGDCDLLAFLDSDDLWPPDYLERMVAALRASPGAVAASADLRFVDAASGEVRFHDQSIHTGWIAPLLYDLLWQQTRGDNRYDGQPPPIPSSTVMRADAFREAGGFDEARRVRNDIDLDLRLGMVGPWVHVAGAPVVHRRHTDRARGGASQLTDGLSTAPHRIAAWRVLADFLLRNCGGPRAWRLRDKLFRQTAQAARHLAASHRTDEAAACAAIAQDVAPWFRWSQRRAVRALANGHALKPATVDITPPPVVTPTPPPSPSSSSLNALDYFHIVPDAHLDKRWGVFVIPIDSDHNDTLTNAPFRQQNVYLNRYAMPYKTIEGWFGYWHILDRVVAGLPPDAQVVELGVAWGCSTVYLASKTRLSGKAVRHVCVDRWAVEADYLKFRENLRVAQVHGNVQAMRMSFDDALKHFEDASLDFIFVDGGHSYEEVKHDITTWWPKLKPGGVMAGDDWCDTWPGVEQAVRELLPEAAFEPTHFWLARKA